MPAGATFDISLAIVELWTMSPKFPFAYAPKSKRHPLTSSSAAGKERVTRSEEIDTAVVLEVAERAIAESVHLPTSIGKTRIGRGFPSHDPCVWLGWACSAIQAVPGPQQPLVSADRVSVVSNPGRRDPKEPNRAPP